LFTLSGFVAAARAVELDSGGHDMFETSVIQSQGAAARRRYSLVSVIAAHSAVIVGGVAISLATIEFPSQAPDQFELLRPVASMAIPPPLGTPQGNDKPRTAPVQQKQTTPPPTQPQEQTAPAIVPDATPQLDAAGPATPGPAVEPGGGEQGTGPRGVEGGDPNSVLKDFDVPLTPAPAVEEKLYTVGGNVKAPRVISRVEPRFPQAMVTARMSGSVTVRCIIDRNGVVKDVEVVRSTFGGFETPVLEALPKWRFAPGSLNGHAVDTIFELNVKFSLNR
jgi:periplasmic protein TonB